MILRVDTFHESYRLLFYSPFWILNRTELKLEFQVNNFLFLFLIFSFLYRLKIIEHLLKLFKHQF
jgi:hypothetical protein